MTYRLYTLAPSHYCERARWALDVAEVAFEEVRLAPGPHVPRIRKLGAPGTSVPVLERPDGPAVQGSARILDWTGLPGGEPELERRLEDRTAPLIRQCLYAGLLNRPNSGVREALLRGVIGRQATIGRAGWPLMRRMMIVGMNTHAPLLPGLIGEVDAELDWFDGVLAERGERLSGPEFGRADLSAAALLAPVALPPTPPVDALYAGLDWPPLLAEALARWAERPVVGWVRRAYAEHRVVPAG